ncbi:hypothetical protein [Paraburkholderia caribensis]|uniref:hypothetical protein n=1 Tax=Paraburkholderia caribensis TaxID=75105 RepID=UPI001D06582A|nr:hypothetical protein [Paraburkholderia caribensis]
MDHDSEQHYRNEDMRDECGLLKHLDIDSHLHNHTLRLKYGSRRNAQRRSSSALFVANKSPPESSFPLDKKSPSSKGGDNLPHGGFLAGRMHTQSQPVASCKLDS